MTALSLTEKDLDKVFVGQWEITQIDDYLTPKAGTLPKVAVVRSKVDHNKNIIKLCSFVPKRSGSYPIPMDGTVGISGKITERSKINDGSISRLEAFWFRAIPPEQILPSSKYSSSQKCYIIKGKVEIDDLVYNSNEEYTFQANYYIEEINNSRYLRGMDIDIPIEKFNTYVQMRDLWYRDYQGSNNISHSEN